MMIKIPIHLLNIEGDGFHLQVKIKINGKVANAIIDTGASKTVFDKDRISHFLKKEKLTEQDRLSTGLGTASMQSHVVKIKKFSIGKLDVLDYDGVVLDLSHVNQTYQVIGLKPIEAVVGSDMLEQFNAVIDYGKKTLVLHSNVAKKKAPKKTVKLAKKVIRKKVAVSKSKKK
ncbi:MAG: retropepsin-like aspartic protease [Bacteroidetes bacterium]|nr:retropepsin-like aspartic protease [Bacteroidota bacterium]